MKLHEQVKVLADHKRATTEGIADIRRYLNLPKFNYDISVNKNDILMRLNELERTLYTIEIQLEG